MKYSLVAGGPSGEHIRLQSGEEALLVASLANLHVQQVGVQGGVVDLYHSHLDGFLCGGDGLGVSAVRLQDAFIFSSC